MSAPINSAPGTICNAATEALFYSGAAYILGGISPLAGLILGVIKITINENLPLSQVSFINQLALTALSTLAASFLVAVICPVIGIPLTFTATLVFSLKTYPLLIALGCCDSCCAACASQYAESR